MLVLILWDFPYNASIGELRLWTQTNGRTSDFIREAQHTRAGCTSVGTSVGHPEARPASWTSSETGQRLWGQLLSGMESLKFTRCWDFPGFSGWKSACQCRGHGFDPWFRKILHAGEQNCCTATTEARTPRACTLHKKSHCNDSSPHSPQLEKAAVQQQRPSTATEKWRNFCLN